MKRVSFEVAKVIKELGYPQTFLGWEDYGYFMNGNEPQIYNHDENDCPMYYHILCVAPTYLEVWLWLWREKGTPIRIDYSFCGMDPNINDPEEAIISAIEHLVNNDLIKI